MEKDPRIPFGGCFSCGGDPDDAHHHDLIRTTLELKQVRHELEALKSQNLFPRRGRRETAAASKLDEMEEKLVRMNEKVDAILALVRLP
jgi:hypothetical protein